MRYLYVTPPRERIVSHERSSSYEYRIGEIRAALRTYGSISRAARALGLDRKRLVKFCHANDIPADRDVPYYLRAGFLKLPPIDGRDELPGMLNPNRAAR